jgi:hypothetical protein
METLILLEEVLGAEFKSRKLSKQFGVMVDRNLGFMEKSPDSNPLIVQIWTVLRSDKSHLPGGPGGCSVEQSIRIASQHRLAFLFVFLKTSNQTCIRFCIADSPGTIA